MHLKVLLGSVKPFQPLAVRPTRSRLRQQRNIMIRSGREEANCFTLVRANIVIPGLSFAIPDASNAPQQGQLGCLYSSVDIVLESLSRAV